MPWIPFVKTGYLGTNQWVPLVNGNGLTAGGGEPVPEIVWVKVSGTSPLSLPGAIANSIKSLTQYGLCTQASTPTPDAPVDIVCNNGAIKYGWYDIITTSQLSGYGTYVSPAQAAQTRAYRWFKDLPNGTYTFSVSGDYEIIVQWRDPADPADGGARFYENLSEWITSGVVTLDKTSGGYGIAVRRTVGTSSITPANFDGTLHVAEQGLYIDGTPEVLTVMANQNTDPTIVKATLASAETDVRYNTTSSCIVAPVKPNTVYTIGFLTKPTGGSIFRAATTKTQVTSSVTSTASIACDLDKNDYEPKTLNSGEDAAWMYVQLSNTMSAEDFASILIQEGTSLTPPQTVTDIPMLLSVNDYKDEAEIISGLLTHKVGVKVFDGTEDWTTDTYGGSRRMVSQYIYNASGGTLAVVCSHYIFRPSGEREQPNSIFIAGSGKMVVYIDSTQSISTVDDWKAFIAAQYAAGTPVIVIYPLATEQTEQTAAHALHTSAGDNVVSVTSNVDPVELEVEYANGYE